MKKILIIGGVLFVLIGGGLAYFYSSLDSIITATVEKVGTRMMAVKVTLKQTKLSLSSGRGEMDDLKIGNPQGYNTDYAARLGKIRIEIDANTVVKNPTIIEGILIEKPEVVYEIGADGSNIAALLKNVEQSLARLSPGGSEQNASTDKKPTKRFIIKNFMIRDGIIRLSATVLQGKTLDVPLPKIYLKNIGRNKNGRLSNEGLSSNEIVMAVLSAVTKAATSAVASADLTQLGLGGAAIDALKAQAKNLLDSSRGTKALINKNMGDVQKIIDQTGKAALPLKDALKNIPKNLSNADAPRSLKKLFGN